MSTIRWSHQVFVVKSGFLGIDEAALQSELDRRGAQGWELVAVQAIGTGLRVFMKRASQ